jgi:uncharacterized membrane protein YkvA (DUF1232 family)
LQPPDSVTIWTGQRRGWSGEMSMGGAAEWDDDKRSRERVARDEAAVRSGFWSKLQRFAAQLPFAEDLLTAYYCAFDRNTPNHVRAALLGALAYFVLPFDFMPDLLPIVGFTDDAAVLAGALRLVWVHIQPAHRDAARDALARLQEE